MNLKKIAGTTALTGALGAAALGVGSGWAQADPDWIDPDIPVPGIDIYLCGLPDGIPDVARQQVRRSY